MSFFKKIRVAKIFVNSAARFSISFPTSSLEEALKKGSISTRFYYEEEIKILSKGFNKKDFFKKEYREWFILSKMNYKNFDFTINK